MVSYEISSELAWFSRSSLEMHEESDDEQS